MSEPGDTISVGSYQSHAQVEQHVETNMKSVSTQAPSVRLRSPTLPRDGESTVMSVDAAQSFALTARGQHHSPPPLAEPRKRLGLGRFGSQIRHAARTMIRRRRAD